MKSPQRQRVGESRDVGRTCAPTLHHPIYPLDEVASIDHLVSGSDASFTWVSGRFLEQEGVGYWHELPFWLPPDQLDFWARIDVSKALQEGLRYRPLADTVSDTFKWDRTRPPESHRSDAGGLHPEKERQVLTAWHDTRSRNPT